MDLQRKFATDSFLLQKMGGNFGAILRDDIATDLAVASLQRNDVVANLQLIDNKITIVAISQQICNSFVIDLSILRNFIKDNLEFYL